MLVRSALAFAVMLFSLHSQAEDTPPIELKEVLEMLVGVWDAEIEVWAQSLDKPPIKFKGIETNRAFGTHWIASDLDSEFMGKKSTVHSIVGYDLDKQQMVGTVIDEGPYQAKLTGDYDSQTKTVTWTTKVKAPDGSPIVQRTSSTQKDADTRELVLSVPGDQPGEFIKFMEIHFTRQK